MRRTYIDCDSETERKLIFLQKTRKNVVFFSQKTPKDRRK
jgi:hypothetical protein